MNQYISLHAILVSLFFVGSHATFSQSNSVSYGMGVNLKQYTFKYADSPMVEIVEDKVNIAISSSKGLKVEIKEFSLKLLECGKLVYGKTFRFSLTANNQMYSSKLNDYRNTIGIVCMGNNFYKLYVKGVVYKGYDKLKLNAQLNCRIKNKYEY